MLNPLLTFNLSLWAMGGAALGAWLRLYCIYFFALTFPGHPVGMILVNTLGSFLIGLVFLPLGNMHLLWLKYLLIGGCLGALTTFSTYALDVYLLWSSRRFNEAVLIGAFVPILSLCAVFLGTWCGKRLFVTL